MSQKQEVTASPVLKERSEQIPQLTNASSSWLRHPTPPAAARLKQALCSQHLSNQPNFIYKLKDKTMNQALVFAFMQLAENALSELSENEELQDRIIINIKSVRDWIQEKQGKLISIN